MIDDTAAASAAVKPGSAVIAAVAAPTMYAIVPGVCIPENLAP